MPLKSNIEWKQWGKDDPLFGVASWSGKQKTGSAPWKEEEFYALGKSDWCDFFEHWKQYGIQNGTCVEIGCGAGRMTHALANFFERVVAIDVSDGMIEQARKFAGKNVEFLLVDEPQIPLGDSSTSAVFSTHVFQHFDSIKIGHDYFREIYRVLKSNGSLMIHIPLYQFPYEHGIWNFLWQPIYAFVRIMNCIKNNLRRLLKIKTMCFTPYSLKLLVNFLFKIGFKRIEYRIFPTSSNLELHSFIFATK